MNVLLTAAAILAEDLRGHVDREGVPAIEHALRVGSRVEGQTDNTGTILAALYHDVLRDVPTGASARFLKHLDAAGYRDIYQTLEVLTRQVGESYQQYIERIVRAGNPDAVMIKLADIYEQLAATRPNPQFKAQYLAATTTLMQENNQ